MKLRIGTRGSHLSRTQAMEVSAHLEVLGHENELVVVVTSGDRSTAPAFGAIGPQGVFVRELEHALLDGRIDLAVHSYKDLPTASSDELVIAAVPPRTDPADLLLSRAGRAGGDGDAMLPVGPGACIGTASVRRQTWVRHFRPDVRAESLRGNVPTRIRRLCEGPYDAILLAAAGVERLRASPLPEVPRLGLDALDLTRLDPGVFVPAPAQGALALQCRRSDDRVRGVLAPLDDPGTRIAVDAERALLARFEGGCGLALGALCVPEGSESSMSAMVAQRGEIRCATLRGPDPAVLADRLWSRLGDGAA